MKKFWIQVILLIGIIVGLLYTATNPSSMGDLLRGNFNFSRGSSSSVTKKLRIGQTVVVAEVADNQAERSKGLSGRESLAENTGMLFLFDTSKKYQFWMKGMRFSIDMIFINNGRVVDLLENLPYPQVEILDKDLPIYQPTEDINMVLEVPAGFSKQNSIKIGDRVFLVQN